MKRKRVNAAASASVRSDDGRGPAVAAERTVMARFYPHLQPMTSFLETTYGVQVSVMQRHLVGTFDPPSRQSLYFERSEPMRVLVQRAQLMLSRTAGANMLTLGYVRPDERTDAFHPLSGLANLFPNTLVTRILTDPEWNGLLDAIGDNAFVHLLLNTAVFMPIGDGSCFVQMCGKPLSDLTDRFNQLDENCSPNPSQVQGTSTKRKRKRRKTKVLSSQDFIADEPAPALPRRLESLRARTGTLSRINSVASAATTVASMASSTKPWKRKTVDINFVRSRIFYARPIRNRRGKVELGLPLIRG